MNKKWIIAIAIIILIGIIVYFNWNKISKWWNGGIGTADGAPCQPIGSSSYDGHFKNGICIKDSIPPKILNQSYNIEITKQGGAHVYNFDGTNFTGTNNIIPFGTKLISTAIITDPATYYQVAQGWLDANDVGITQVK